MTSSRRRLAILDVGHGNSAVLMDETKIVVIDAGPRSALLEFLNEQGIKHINVLLISHSDKDHLEGIVALIASGVITVGAIYLNVDSSKHSELWDDVTWLLGNEDKKGKCELIVSLTDKDTGKFDTSHVQVQILGPTKALALKGAGSADHKGRQLTSNSMSVVVRLVNSAEPFALFLGDIDDVGLINLLETGVDMTATAMVFPHHGGYPGKGNPVNFVSQLCKAVNPNTIVFSIGRMPFDNPQTEILAAIRKEKPLSHIICTQLSKKCSEKIPATQSKHLNSIYAHGKERRFCCGGSILMDFGGQKICLYPDNEEHGEFVRSTIPDPLCLKASAG